LPARRSTRLILSLYGVVAALAAFKYQEALELQLQDFSIDTQVAATGGALKFGYRGIVALAAFVARRQLAQVALGSRRFAAAHATILRCWLSPTVYPSARPSSSASSTCRT
jgi:hypothetical protein